MNFVGAILLAILLNILVSMGIGIYGWILIKRTLKDLEKLDELED